MIEARAATEDPGLFKGETVKSPSPLRWGTSAMQSRARLLFVVALAAYAGPAIAQSDMPHVQPPPKLSPSDLAALWIYTAIGVAILWAKMKRAQRSVYGLSAILDVLIPKRMKRLKQVTELFCYLFLGCIVVMGVVEPGTPAQALAAGLGWTSLTTR